MARRPGQGRRPPGHGRHPRERGRARLLPDRHLPGAGRPVAGPTSRCPGDGPESGADDRQPREEQPWPSRPNHSRQPVPEPPSRPHPGRGHGHAHRPRSALRDGGPDHPGHPHPDVEDRAGHPPGGARALRPPRRQGLPGLRGRADHLRRALPDRGRPGPRPHRPVRHHQGRPGGHRHAQPARVGHGLLGLDRRRGRRRPPQCLVDRARAGLRAQRLGDRAGLRRRGAPGTDPPPPRRDPRPPGHGGVLRGARPGRWSAGGRRDPPWTGPGRRRCR